MVGGGATTFGAGMVSRAFLPVSRCDAETGGGTTAEVAMGTGVRVLSRATARHAQDRYDSAEQFLTELRLVTRKRSRGTPVPWLRRLLG